MTIMPTINEDFQKKQRQLARQLRQSAWWQRKLNAPNLTCYYCERKIDKREATMEHIVPIQKGGLSHKSNLVVACKSCNTEKKDMNPVDWLLKNLK